MQQPGQERPNRQPARKPSDDPFELARQHIPIIRPIDRKRCDQREQKPREKEKRHHALSDKQRTWAEDGKQGHAEAYRQRPYQCGPRRLDPNEISKQSGGAHTEKGDAVVEPSQCAVRGEPLAETLVHEEKQEQSDTAEESEVAWPGIAEGLL